MTHKRPSPDIDAIRGVLQSRADENNRNPISIFEEDLSINSPVSLEKSIGRMNNSFSRTQVASSLAGSHKLSMEDTKRQLFEEQEAEPVEDSNEEHPSVMQNRQENLVRQLLQQQKELQNLENRQKELTELKRVAEARLSAANETANFTLFTQAETDRYDQQMELEEEQYNPAQATRQGYVANTESQAYNTNDTVELTQLEQQFMAHQARELEQQYSHVQPGDRPYDMSEIPYQIEQVNGDSSLVAYEDSEEDEGMEEGMEDSLEVLQKRLSLLHEKQKWLEQKSKEHQEAAEHSFNNSSTEPPPPVQPQQAWLQQQPTQQVLVNGNAGEGTFELTGHANDADYEALCGKVDELKDKKKYMDQLLSYYTLLRQTNSSAEQMINQPPTAPAPPQIFNEQGSDPNTFYQQAKYIEPQRTASPAAQRMASPAGRSASRPLAQHVPPPPQQASPSHNSGDQAQASDRLTQADRNERPVSAKHVSRYALDQATELEAVREESRRLRAQQQQRQNVEQQQRQNLEQQQQQQQQQVQQQQVQQQVPEEGPEEMKKLQDIKAMRSQLTAIQSEMAGIQFNDDDSAANVGSKLKGLEITRNRVKELRDRLMAFEEAPAQPIPTQPAATGDDQMHMLAAAREKLEYLHSLSNKVKVARAGNNGIPEELLKEISILVPDEEIEEEEDKEEKFTSLLRKKQELETVQNELKQLRDQQELLHTMDQSGEEARVVIADEDREQLWDTLREKQCAQLDRLKKGEKYEAESCDDGYTTRATWGGSSIRSVDTGDAPDVGDDVEGGKYADKTQEDDELEEDLVEEDTEAQLVYELETNYWVEHCRDLSKQLAERTTTIHSLLAERKDKKATSTKDLHRQLEDLHIENEHLHSELNEVYGSESYQGPGAAPPQNPDVSNLGKIDESLYSTGSTSQRHRAPLPFPPYAPYHPGYPGYYYPPPPHYPPYAPHYPPYPPQQHGYQQYYDPYNPPHTPQYDPAQYQNMQYGQPPPPRGVSSLYNESSLYSEDISRLYDDPNSPYVTRRGGEESLDNTLDKDGLAIDTRDQKRGERNVSFSQQVATAGDTISTQFPTPRRQHAAQKLAEQAAGTSVNPQNLSKSSVQNLIKSECEDTQSISSTISSYVNERREKEKSTFDTLQNTVYSEVASLISANEARPHYLIELVKELGGLKNDYLRQRHLYMLRDLISNYIPSDTGDKQIPWPRDNWQLSMSEATPSNNSVASENDFELVKGSNVSVQDADYDYLESVENASSVSTNNSHPFASDSLGATAINLSRDLSDVRQREEMERRLEEMVQNVIAKYGMKRSESSSAADNTSESSGAVSPFDILEQEVKRVMLQVIPLLRDNFASPLTEELISQIKDIVIHSAGNVFDSDQISENFSSNLSTALAKYASESVEQCAHDIIVDLSEVLFQDVHTVHIIVDEEISDVGMDEDSDDDEHGPTPTPQDLRSRFLASTCGYEESDDPELEFDERRGGEVECAVSHVTEDQEDEEDELKIVDEDELHPRFSETGELFSDEGMSSRDEGMSDIVDLPPTSGSDDEVPTKEVTLSDLPTKLTMPSYRDAVLSGNSQHSEHSDHAAVLEVLDDTELVGDGDSIREPPIAGEK